MEKSEVFDASVLIEGASGGKGLGIKFLQHIERAKILFHLISAESEDPSADYKVIRKELETYSSELAKKSEYLFLSKSDILDPADLKKRITALKKLNKNVISISIHDEDSLKGIKQILNKIQDEK